MMISNGQLSCRPSHFTMMALDRSGSYRSSIIARLLAVVVALIVAVVPPFSFSPCLAYTFQYADSGGNIPLRWPVKVIQIAFAPSLYVPPANVKSNSDALSAARRALARWEVVTNFQFVEFPTGVQSVSSPSAPDGINVVTLAQTPENAALFEPGLETTSRTRVFFNPANGAISEADITVNPALLYSTDGTPGTYDLETTFTHEIGHLLGLDHSAIVGATMQPLQGRNGNYNLPAITGRTLSSDDVAGIKALYGKFNHATALSGTVTTAGGAPVFGAHVWVESLKSGSVVAGTLSRSNGGYIIEGLAPGDYRVVVASLNGPISAGNLATGNRLYTALGNQLPFLAAEVVVSLTTQSPAATANFTVISGQPAIIPQLVGLNGQLTTSAVPLTAGARYRLYVGGPGLDQIPASGLTSLSPLIAVDSQSLRLENFGTAFPVIGFDVRVAGRARAANYTVRFTGDSGESAYLVGALSVESVIGEQTAAPSSRRLAAERRSRQP